MFHLLKVDEIVKQVRNKTIIGLKYFHKGVLFG